MGEAGWDVVDFLNLFVLFYFYFYFGFDFILFLFLFLLYCYSYFILILIYSEFYSLSCYFIILGMLKYYDS